MPSSEHAAVVEAISANPLDSNLSFEDQRAYLNSLVGLNPLPQDVVVTAKSANGVQTDLICVSGSREDLIVMHFHGGGYVLGSSRGHREFGARLSRATKSTVLMVDYRLAPEHPYPAALDDAVAAYTSMLAEGFDSSQIIFSGDSAGGGLAIAAMLALKSLNLPLPSAAVCFSPWVDLALTGSTIPAGVVDDPITHVRDLSKMAGAYAPGRLKDPFVSPIYGDLKGLPPLCILVGDREILLDDSRRLALQARKARVPVAYFEGQGLIHAWPILIPNAPESADALRYVGHFYAAPKDSRGFGAATAEDRLEIQDAICGVTLQADCRNFAKIPPLFTSDATMDYSELFGDDQTSVPVGQFFTDVRSFLPGFDATQHLVTNFDIKVFGDVAYSTAQVRASHWIDDKEWVVGLTYHHQLQRLNSKWKIRHLAVSRRYEIGERLIDIAAKRLRAVAG
jgi:epsilon-lactone hydrolase